MQDCKYDWVLFRHEENVMSFAIVNAYIVRQSFNKLGTRIASTNGLTACHDKIVVFFSLINTPCFIGVEPDIRNVLFRREG